MKIYFLSFATLLLSSLLLGKVEVIEISPRNTSDLPGGKEADGIIGDFVLRNSNIEVTIGSGAPNRKANMGAFWGPNGVLAKPAWFSAIHSRYLTAA